MTVMNFSAPAPFPALQPNDPLKAGQPRSRVFTLSHGRWQVYCVHVPQSQAKREWWVSYDLKRIQKNGEPAFAYLTNSWDEMMHRLCI